MSRHPAHRRHPTPAHEPGRRHQTHAGRLHTQPRPPLTEHLALYGTLRPGEENHWLVRNLAGEWRTGRVRGWTYPIGWGPAEGFPGITLGDDGPAVDVAVLSSDRLDGKWRELDDFEGAGYRRVETDVELDVEFDGHRTVRAWIYETVADVE